MAQDKKRVLFGDTGVVAMVMLPKGEEYLDINDDGSIVIPEGVKPKGFLPIVAFRKGSRTVVVQRNLGRIGGDYGHVALSDMNLMEGFDSVMMHDPITVIRDRELVYTKNAKDIPNRMDIWFVGEDGRIELFQVGVITHDNGKTWILLGEYAWSGRLFKAAGRVVGRPDAPQWGSFDVRRSVLEEPGVKALVESAELAEWEGSDEELYPKLVRPPEGTAVVDWYKTFMGRTGQGIAVLHDGTNVWVNGADAKIELSADGIKRFSRGDVIRYTGIESIGKNIPGKVKVDKLVGITRVNRVQ